MKKIVFLTGTRADFGKLKSLIEIISSSDAFEVHIFATGMHMNPRYGRTVDEIFKCGFNKIFTYYNHYDSDAMDTTLAKTIEGFSHYIKDIRPDLIVVHGDRVEALAGAIVGSLNNFLTAHIEGGEVSGTVDELVRHSVSKLSHIHFVSNAEAKRRLIQMGEDDQLIYIIGSPDIDIMMSDKLPGLSTVKKVYDIPFDKYSLLVFHPVTTEFDKIRCQVKNLVDAVLESGLNYVIVSPNNDHGADLIFLEYKRLENNPKIRIFPSIRFERFLVLLKNATFILGNSSSGIREAPYYGIPTINIGSRQQNRSLSKEIINCGHKKIEILGAISEAQGLKLSSVSHFGEGKSAEMCFDILKDPKIWNTSRQKCFNDMRF
ncbi:MAG: UDP-N-acetyl-D-glucosamine 2-epimerase, UDP-hydrolysing [Gammaproteobacteria bacterium GWF2_41_13]|nr:MAG: UDP-N-acetyl-D-glucosamine 2-epimerase, UDP-hydrolysing [Gammaproteobacteria bacterium GWF2_41_13]